MHRCSRRRALALAGAVLAPATAGCSILDDSEEPERTTFRDWLPGEEIWSSTGPQVTYESLQPILQSYPQNHSRSEEVQSLASQFGLGSFRFEGRLTIDTVDLYGVVLLGDFDAEDVLDGMDLENTTTESRGDYTLVGSSQAVGRGSVVYSSQADRLVDTARGDVERIADVDEDWERIVGGDVADADLCRFVSLESASFEVLGIGADVEDGPSFAGSARALFPSEEAAADGVQVARAAVTESVRDDVETQIRNSSVDGDAVAFDLAWDAYPF